MSRSNATYIAAMIMRTSIFLAFLVSGLLFNGYSQGVPVGVLVKVAQEPEGPSIARAASPGFTSLGWQEVFSGANLPSRDATSRDGIRLNSERPQTDYRWYRNVSTVNISSPSDYGRAWENVYRELERPAIRALGGQILAAEPSVQVLRKIKNEPSEPECAGLTSSGALSVRKKADWASAWPHGTTAGWHLDPERTQLQLALDKVDASRATNPNFKPARIAIIDTGFDTNNPSIKGINFDGIHKLENSTGIIGNDAHGSGTLSILAGQSLKVRRSSAKDDELIHGANPHAQIVGFYGASGVAHVFSTASIAEGLDRAATSRVDVISLSMGGWPSPSVRDAANKAYKNGTAIFCASGDYIAIPFSPILTPTFMVYPAAYECCVGVAGVTASEESYARGPSWFGWIRDYSHWIERGCAGPKFAMSRSVAAYSPNIPWAVKGATECIDLDGSGTSASTPQVAGAASLWFETHRDAVMRLAGDEPWKKAELIYQALLRNAVQPGSCNPAEDHTFAFGKGVIKANRSLDAQPDAAWLQGGQRLGKRSLNWILVLLSMAYHQKPATPARMAAAQIELAPAQNAALQAVRSTFNLQIEADLSPARVRGQNQFADSLLGVLHTEAEQKLARAKGGALLLAQLNQSNAETPEALLAEIQVSSQDAKKLLRLLAEDDCSDRLRNFIQTASATLKSSSR